LACKLDAERRVRFFTCDASDQYASTGRNDQCGDLRHQTIADGQKAVTLQRGDGLEALLTDSDREPAQDIDQSDEQAGDHVAFD